MKPNPLLAQIKARHRAELFASREFTLQQCEDMLFITLDEVEYPEKEEFVKIFWDVFLHWADMNHRDYQSDKKTVYTKEDVDRRLRQIRGDKFVSREERYYMVREKP